TSVLSLAGGLPEQQVAKLLRVRRMLNPASPLRRVERLAGVASVALLLSGPAAVALVPGFASFVAHHCHSLLSF
ncbi:hypothetical protein ACWEPL_64870, partial [Nonomuraea sp. NPDC004186]